MGTSPWRLALVTVMQLAEGVSDRQAAETTRAALNASVLAVPEWVREHADPEWFERYSRRIEDYRLPKGKEARGEYLERVGADGMQLLARIDATHTLENLKKLAEVEVLRKS
jgi:transposase